MCHLAGRFHVGTDFGVAVSTLNVLTPLPEKKICGKRLSLAVFSGRLVIRRLQITNVAVQRVVF